MVTKNGSCDANDIVIVVEATANLVAHWEAVKKMYLAPALNFFYKKTANNTDLLSDLDGNRYGLVLFYAADRTPDSVTQCFKPTSSLNSMLKLLDAIQFDGGGGEHYSHVTEGLATALQLFHDLRHYRPETDAKRFCFLVSTTPPYSMPCFESFEYAGSTGTEICEKMKEQHIKMSLISPRHIADLQQIFVQCNGCQPPLLNYALDRRHLVLVHGFELPTEKEPVPVSKQSEDVNSSLVSVKETTEMEIDTITTSTNGFTQSAPQSSAPFLSDVQVVVSSAPVSTTGTYIKPEPIIKATVNSVFPPSASLPSSTSSAAIGSIGVSVTAAKSANPLATTGSGPITTPSVRNVTNAKMVADNIVKITQQPQQQTQPLWAGTLEWLEKRKSPDGANPQKIPHNIPCKILPQRQNTDINTSSWPPKLIMQIIPQMLLTNAQSLLRQPQSQFVVLQFPFNDMFKLLLSNMQRETCGLIQINSSAAVQNSADSKMLVIIILKKKDDKNQIVGVIPGDSSAVMNAIRHLAQYTKQQHQQQHLQQQQQQQQQLQQQQQQRQQQHVVSQGGKMMSQSTVLNQANAASNIGGQVVSSLGGMGSASNVMVTGPNSNVSLQQYAQQQPQHQQQMSQFQRAPTYSTTVLNQGNIQLATHQVARMNQPLNQSGMQQTPNRVINVSNAQMRPRLTLQPKPSINIGSNIHMTAVQAQSHSGGPRTISPVAGNVGAVNRLGLQQLQNSGGMPNRQVMHDQRLRHLLRNNDNISHMGRNVRPQGNPGLRQVNPTQMNQNYVVRNVNTMQRMPDQQQF